MGTIMVQMANRDWTLKALHLACGIARHSGEKIALLRFIPVQHFQWLGTSVGRNGISKQDDVDFQEYCATLEDYGVEFCLSQMQYHTLDSAIVEAAECLNASIVFATLPPSLIRPWRTFLLQHLERRLYQQHRQLYTLESASNSPEWTPAVMSPTSK